MKCPYAANKLTTQRASILSQTTGSIEITADSLIDQQTTMFTKRRIKIKGNDIYISKSGLTGRKSEDLLGVLDAIHLPTLLAKVKEGGKGAGKTTKNDKNQFLPKNQKTKNQQLNKLKRLNFNFHSPEIPSSNLGLATR